MNNEKYYRTRPYLPKYSSHLKKKVWNLLGCKPRRVHLIKKWGKKLINNVVAYNITFMTIFSWWIYTRNFVFKKYIVVISVLKSQNTYKYIRSLLIFIPTSLTIEWGMLKVRHFRSSKYNLHIIFFFHFTVHGNKH